MHGVLRRLTGRPTSVERYWGRHTVNSVPFESASASSAYLEWRFGQYPLFRELMDLWGSHDDETILDYGCGPGDDVTGFLPHTGALRVIGADVSQKAYELLTTSDSQPGLPLADAAVDYVHCGGVIQHTTAPELVLRELARVLRPGGRGRILVYNRNSLWFHLYTAHTRRIGDGLYAGVTADEAFARNTDGPDCPISRAFRPAEFSDLAGRVGFEVEFLGGYFPELELDLRRTSRAAALADPLLDPEHKEFLGQLTDGPDGYPRFEGDYAGVGGVYAVRRPA